MDKPPFQLTAEVLQLLTQIERLIGRCEGFGGSAPGPLLRRENRIRTVHATTAIEGNTLSMEQVTAIFDGKRVRGPRREVAEVTNAIAAYEAVQQFDPTLQKDLLRAHGLLMRDLAEDAGRYRRGNVGVMVGSRVAHMAPPAKRVAALMDNLFDFLKRDATTPALVKACVFHYELEFIHPFSDGNGRAGRLWQHTIACAYSPVFVHAPIESLIKARQQAYYDALACADKAADSTSFVVFMLELMLAALARMVDGARSTRESPRDRLLVAVDRFGRETFSRAQYLKLHPRISGATASRDLRMGVEQGLLRKSGDKATTRYMATRQRAR
jgi:Fic family protein